MIHKIMVILALSLLPIMAESLTSDDIKNLQKRTIKEHIVYETYLETDDGHSLCFWLSI